MQMESNRKKLERLLKQKYPKNVYVSIYTILKKSNHTVNKNGFFFNLAEVSDEDIKKCVEYIECIDHNIEDHMKNLNIRENLETTFKSKLSEFRKELPQQKKKQNVKEKATIEQPLVAKKVYKGVYKRLDRVVKGLKKEEVKEPKKKKIIKKDIENIEEINEFSEDNDEDLFGSECSEQNEVLENDFLEDEGDVEDDPEI
jgi:hypothetical protein